MPNPIYEKLKEGLSSRRRTWLVTGAAGFIGSNLVETLLGLGQRVTGLDDFSTGNRANLEQVAKALPGEFSANFRLVEGSICDTGACDDAVAGAELVLHQAALGSVPRSIERPARSAEANVLGFFQVLDSARKAGVKRVVYASSSSVYGDSAGLPKMEGAEGKPLSPYALTKWMNEETADTFQRVYGLDCIGLRYFNVFGERQDPNGPYAAVIPLWIKAMIRGEPIVINGDGETSRDFCYVANAVQANLLAAAGEKKGASNKAYNVACGQRTSLNELADLLWRELNGARAGMAPLRVEKRDFRAGDVRHSLADISRSKELLGYSPEYGAAEGVRRAIRWYLENT